MPIKMCCGAQRLRVKQNIGTALLVVLIFDKRVVKAAAFFQK